MTNESVVATWGMPRTEFYERSVISEMDVICNDSVS